MALRKFLLLEARHAHPGEGTNVGKIFKKGEIVESEHDLVALFPNKFREHNLVPASQAIDAAELAEFRAWKDAKKAPPAPTEEAPPTEEKGTTPPKEAVSSTLGEDVTSEFKAAIDAGMLVFKHEDMYFVTETDDPNKALNEKPLEDAKHVNKFIHKALKEE